MKFKVITTTVFAAAISVGLSHAAEGDTAEKAKPESGKRPDGPPAEVIAKYDKDGDGKLDETERAEAAENRPARPGEGDGKGRPAAAAGGELFKRADKNGDGKLSKDEIPEATWDRLSKADKDSDGSITEEEIKAAGGGRPGATGGGGAPGDRLKEMDANKDGNLSKDEVPERVWGYMSRADTNKDDVLSKEELEAMRAAGGGRPGGGRPGQGGGGAEMFTNFDKNKDDKLTSDEVPEAIWERMSKADKDADGAVSKAELEAAHSALSSDTAKGADDKPKRPKIES